MDYGSGTSRRQTRPQTRPQPQTDQNYPYGTYDGFNVDQSQPQAYGGQYFSGYSIYEPSVPQLFEDTSGQQFGQQFGEPFGAQNDAMNAYQSQTYMNSANAYPSQMYASMNSSNLINQQMLLSAGQQILTNPMAAAALDAYSQNIVNKGKSWIGNNVKYYFAVDTSYVLKKLLLIFFPFTHKDWSVRYNTDESVAPRDDINAPDLYIPTMAFVTYVLVSGYLLGLQNRFSPEQLGIQASTALAWLLFEVVVVLMALYLFSISCTLGFFHMISYGGYKFVCIVATLIASMPFNNLGYYITLGYCSLSLGFFLMRSLHIAMQTANKQRTTVEPRNGLYLVIIICLIQPLIMYFLTRHFIFTPNTT